MLATGGLAASCTTETVESDPEDADDGKVHPPPNGVHITEQQACTALQDAIQAQALTLGCSTTVRPCPTYLRAQFQTACMEYDEGSVTGCVAYYQSVSSCAELDPTICVVIPYPGTEPAGCPP